ncbi:MAG: hypothetical protein HRU46_14895 [Verrucomicrobiales bacterium]|nr:hypothetical protein [Verrucomicrobiales bacterium]
MNFPAPTFHRMFTGCLAALFLASLRAESYDAPDFDYIAFQRDGVFLETSDQESLLEALAAVACNFANKPKVDDDIREKALAIALRIEPLHYNSRQAHQALVSGETPPATPYFDTLSRVSETLWSTSSRLRSDPVEPEEKKLSGYLMEISLALHPDPPAERLREYAAATKGRPLLWKNFVTLDAIENRSTSRTDSLRREAMDLLKRPRTVISTGTNPSTIPSVATDLPPSDGPNHSKVAEGSKGMQPDLTDRSGTEPSPADLSDFEPISRTMQMIRNVRSVANTAMAGSLTINIRPAVTQAEKELLLPPEGSSPQTVSPLPLYPTPDGPSLEDIQMPRSILGETELEWTDGTIGELTFESEQEPPGPWQTCNIPVRTPVIALLQAALSDGKINQDIALAGDSNSSEENPRIEGNLEEYLIAAKSLDQPYLLIPADVGTDLMAYLNETQDLSVLFEPELMMYTTRSAAISKMTSPTPDAWITASESFTEIKDVSERMALVDLARNAKVQERLEAILEVAPLHLSAWAMLEFGKSSPDAGSVASAPDVTEKISDLMAPYFALRGSDPDLNDLRQRFDQAERGLSEVRQNLPLELRRYQAAAEDALEAIDDYLSLSNRDTSIGIQKLNLVNEALQRVAAERAELDLAN